MSDPLGKIEVISRRLRDYVIVACGGAAFNDFHVGVRYLGTFPLTSIDIGTITLQNENFTRLTPEQGLWAYYEFDIYIHRKLDYTVANGVPDSIDALDMAETLMDYLIEVRGNT